MTKDTLDDLLRRRISYVRKHQDQIKADAFMFGSDNFTLPFAKPMPTIPNLSDWQLQLHHAVDRLKRANELIQRFRDEARTLPYVCLMVMRKETLFKKSVQAPSFLTEKNLSRNVLEWTLYIQSGQNTKHSANSAYRKKVNWAVVDTLLQSEQRNHDETICHQRANAIMIDLNARSLLATQEIRILIQSVSLLRQMDLAFYKNALWWAGIGNR